jgi:hypothetical protein
MEDLIEESISQRVCAVVGASTDADKFGHKIFCIAVMHHACAMVRRRQWDTGEGEQQR